MCYARKDEVIVTSDNRSPKKGSGTKQSPQPHIIQQAKFCTIGESTYLVVASTVGVQLYNVDGTKLLNFFPLNTLIEENPEKFAFARGITCMPTTEHLVVGTSSGSLLVLALSPSISLELHKELPGHKAPVVACAASATLLASADDTGEIILRNSSEGYREVATFRGYGSVCTSLAFASPEVLVAGYASGHIRYFRVGSVKALYAEITAHARCVSAIDAHPSQPLVASAGEDSYLCLWSVPDFDAKGSQEISLVYSDKVADQVLTGVQFYRDRSERIACTAYDSEIIHIWSKS